MNTFVCGKLYTAKRKLLFLSERKCRFLPCIEQRYRSPIVTCVVFIPMHVNSSTIKLILAKMTEDSPKLCLSSFRLFLFYVLIIYPEAGNPWPVLHYSGRIKKHTTSVFPSDNFQIK